MDDAGELSTRHPTGRRRFTAVLAFMAAALVVIGGVGAGLLHSGGSSARAAAHAPLPRDHATVTPTQAAHAAPVSTACAGQPPGCGTVTGTAAALARGTWSTLAIPPRSIRNADLSVWTGSQLLVWGGGRDNSNGAAFTPATGRWTALPPSPLSGRGNASAVWDGSAMLIWGGYSRTVLDDGAAYEPATRTWTMLPPAPISGRYLATMLWTGTEAVVLGGNTGTHGGDSVGAAYDPSTRIWTALPAFPIPARARNGPSIAVWTGSRIVALGHFVISDRLHTVAAAWLPGTGDWTPLPTPRFAYQPVEVTATWTGRSAVLSLEGGGCAGPPGPCGGPIPAGAVLLRWTPGTGRLRPEAGTLSTQTIWGSAWTGRALVELDGYTPVAFGTGGDLRRLPLAGAPKALWEPGTFTVWTGSQLLVMNLYPSTYGVVGTAALTPGP